MKENPFEDGVTYEAQNDGSVVIRHGVRIERLTKEILRFVIENIKRNRADYATEAAWRRDLAYYEGALAHFRAETSQDAPESTTAQKTGGDT